MKTGGMIMSAPAQPQSLVRTEYRLDLGRVGAMRSGRSAHSFGSRLKRQKHGEHGSAQRILFAGSELNRPAVTLGDLLADPQSQPGADVFLRREKRLKDVHAIFYRHARTAIGNADFYAFGF